MPKIKEVTKKTHTYILPEYDNIVVHAISETHVEEYQKDGKQVYSAPATKMVDGKKTDTVNYYVAIDDFVKKTASRSSLASRLRAAVSSTDPSSMSAAELLAIAGIKL